MDRLELRSRMDVRALDGTLARRVYETLKRAIVTLEFPPGTLLRKGPICAELGVSRAPVAEAIARLQIDGLVDVVPQSGTRVSRFAMAEIREAAFMREALELAAVARVATTATPDERTGLDRSICLQQALLDAGDTAGFYAADEAFHDLLMAATGYPHLAATVNAIALRLRRPRMLLLPEPGRPREAFSEHLAIFAAIDKGDPDAARTAMRLHLGQLVGRLEPLEKAHPEYFRS